MKDHNQIPLHVPLEWLKFKKQGIGKEGGSWLSPVMLVGVEGGVIRHPHPLRFTPECVLSRRAYMHLCTRRYTYRWHNDTAQSSPKLDADIHQESRAGEGASDKEMLHGKENEGTWL